MNRKTAAVKDGERLKVNEIYFSIQGESTYTGKPCIFIRLTGCDLRCHYCDSEYTFFEGSWMERDQILEEIQKYPTSLVEITGGEPLLQYGTPDLAKQLLERNYTVLIETSGSQDLLRLDPAVVKICDVKTPSSGEVDRFFWKNLETFTARDQLKFVIGNREDFDFSVAWLKAYPVPCELLFSPVYRELEPSLLASWILQEGLAVRLQIQLHKFLWPSAKRGV